MTNIIKNSTSAADNGNLITEHLDEAGLESATRLFYQAFTSKFKTVSNMPEAQRQAVLAMFWQRGLSDPYDRHFQVKRNGKLVAVYGLTYGVKRPPQNAPAPVSSLAILRKAGFIPFLKIRRIFQLFVHIPAADTAYLSYLCVDESLRGTGIGNQILDEITAQLRADPVINRLSLYVSDLNTKARELYLRRGFQDVKYETSHTTKRYMDIYGWYYMALPII
ncbi:TPA: GNAT family N-acetyltransferase [Morganella morganii]|uniref:GNAT family N-acetyltransferase n=1 Tax=Morganella morganii TaxID=582 RepID=UPI001A28B4A4|nr:N-acetyltransferase [Morganella morganii]MCU6237829.1 GNAT family N-acetyltransferase [Morganella morganii]HAT1526470.1 GNAT family N-acetyltransferase [Morganella morganii]HDF2364570.1 GNAT family N-acetyltransferase [Morganella morganii]HDF2423192.1 GNAT family N-acetyltransferase [Morganella morganii]